MTRTAIPRAGTLLGRRYALVGPLGRGGSGEVHRAVDVRLDRPVALKVFQLASAPPEEIRRYAREARVLSGLSHPSLVALLDVGADTHPSWGPVAFLAMELVDGPTLRDVLDEGPLDARETALVGLQLAQALGHAHGVGIVHRDVKPSNVLLDAQRAAPPGHDRRAPAVVLADFGIALHSSAAGSPADSSGTAGYHSPEQALGRPLAPSSDVYSLGLVLLECRTGRRAFPGDPLSASLARLLEPVQVPDELGPDWCRLLRAMTADDPDRRPAAAAVAAELRALAV